MKKLALIIVFILTGCDNALTCNDSKAKIEVLAVIDSHLTGELYDDIKSKVGKQEISRISTIESDEDLGRYSCSAQYAFEYEGDTKTIDFTYKLNYLEDKKESEVLVDVGTIKGQYIFAIATMHGK